MHTTVDVFAKARDHERKAILDAAREAGIVPYFRTLESAARPVVVMEGAQRIMLGGNNYLGLTEDERVIAGARDALERYGTGLTGSRFLNGTLDLHLELEAEIAGWYESEAALVFTTGHQANLGALGTLLGAGDTVVADSGDHASILDGCLLSRAKLRAFRHGRLDKLDRQLARAAADGGGVLIVVDGVFSMEGDIAHLPAIADAARRAGARLMVDEAHGVGVLGAHGRGSGSGADLPLGRRSGALCRRARQRPLLARRPACARPSGRRCHHAAGRVRAADADRARPRRRRLEGRPALARPLRRRRVRQRGPAPGGSPGRSAATHERDGHPRPGHPRPGAAGVRRRQAHLRGRARAAAR